MSCTKPLTRLLVKIEENPNDVRQMALKVSGLGTGYVCRISGNETYLFDDEGRWFVEAK